MIKHNTYSTIEIIESLRNYRKEVSEEAIEPILYFVSFLTNISVDKLNELTNDNH